MSYRRRHDVPGETGLPSNKATMLLKRPRFPIMPIPTTPSSNVILSRVLKRSSLDTVREFNHLLSQLLCPGQMRRVAGWSVIDREGVPHLSVKRDHRLLVGLRQHEIFIEYEICTRQGRVGIICQNAGIDRRCGQCCRPLLRRVGVHAIKQILVSFHNRPQSRDAMFLL